MTYDEGLDRLEGRARWTTIVLWLFAALGLLTAGGQLLEAAGVVNIDGDINPLVMALGVTYLAYTALFIVSVVLVAMWIHRGHANLHESGMAELEFTPNWAVGWYFVPFANLVMPFKAMRELWNASHGRHDPFGGTAPGLVKAWWTAWIAGNILDGIGSRVLSMEDGGAGSLVWGNGFAAAGSVTTVVGAILLTSIVRAVTRAQRSGGSAVTVFA